MPKPPISLFIPQYAWFHLVEEVALPRWFLRPIWNEEFFISPIHRIWKIMALNIPFGCIFTSRFCVKFQMQVNFSLEQIYLQKELHTPPTPPVAHDASSKKQPTYD